MAKKQDLCRGPLLSGMLLYALPVMATGLLQVLYNAADTMVIGQFAGDESLAAVSSTSSLTSLFVNVFLGLSNGIIAVVGRHIGAKNHKKVRESVHTTMLLGIVCGLFLLVFGLLAAGPMLKLMGTDAGGAAVLSKATLYIKIYFLGAPALLVYNFGAAILRAAGDSKRPLIFLTISGVTNVLLNLFLVIACRLDVAGVAIATTVSQYLSAGLVWWCLARENSDIRLVFSRLRFHGKQLREILRMGVPSGIQSALFAFTNVLIQSSINSFGDLYMAGNGASVVIENFVTTAMNAFYTTTLAFTSQNFGAHNKKRIYRSLWIGAAQSFVFTAVAASVALIFSDALLRLFTSSPVAIQAGQERLLVMSLAYLLGGFMNSLVAHLRGIGVSIVPMISTLAGVCGLRLVWVWWVFPTYHSWSILFVCFPVSYVLVITAHLVTVYWAKKHVLDRISDASVSE